MFIGGVWHGADWTYVVWGTLNALAMVIERFVLTFDLPRRAWEAVPRAIQAFYTFTWFSITMFFFRAYPITVAGADLSGIEVSMLMLKRTLTFASGDFPVVPIAPFVLGIIMLLGEFLVERRPNLVETAATSRTPMYLATALVLVLCFFIYSVTASPQFIYFQF